MTAEANMTAPSNDHTPFTYLFIIALQHHAYNKDYKKKNENYDV